MTVTFVLNVRKKDMTLSIFQKVKAMNANLQIQVASL